MSDAAGLSPMHEAIAEAHGIRLYGRYGEAAAADLLDMSIVLLRRIRATGRIAFVRPSPRKISYFGYQLVEYLLSSVETPPCPATERRADSSLAHTGSRNDAAPPPGAAPGSTPRPDKHAALASAQRILTRRANA